MKQPERKPKFIINRSEIAAGTRGSSLGPDALRIVAWDQQNDLFSRYPIEEISTVNHLLDLPTKYPYAKRIDGLVNIYNNVVQSVHSSLISGFFPIILAGDHASAGGTIAGIKAAYPDQTIGVIWIDAHGDLHTPYTTPSGNMHGMPLAVALGDDNIECKKNDISQEEKTLWNELKNIGYIGAKIKAENLVFVGVRDTEKEENQLINRKNIRNFSVTEFLQKGVELLAEEITLKLKDCDRIYLSFDVDSMDPEETGHGTGTPVNNGLPIDKTKKLITILSKNPKLTAIEFVEINPCLDEKKNRMAEIAFDILEDVITKNFL